MLTMEEKKALLEMTKEGKLEDRLNKVCRFVLSVIFGAGLGLLWAYFQ